MIEATDDFRSAMSLLTSAVSVVTTAGDCGRYGFTASAVCSVTDTPPTLLVCMNKSSYLHTKFVENKILAVNVLGALHQEISNIFASKLDAVERFKHGSWNKLKTGAPALADSLVTFDCELEQAQTVGTHDIFICRVVAIKQNQQEQGLAYFNRAYHQVGQATARHSSINTARHSNHSIVGCTCSPQSHSLSMLMGLSHLPPPCDSNGEQYSANLVSDVRP